MTGLTLAAIALSLISAVLSAAEAAVFSIGSSRLRTLVEEGFGGAAALSEIRSRPARAQAVTFLANTLANLGALGLIVGLGTLSWGGPGLAISLPLGALFLVLFTELLPRAIASRHPIRVALAAAPAILSLVRWTGPLVTPLIRLEDFLATYGDENGATVEEREVRDLTTLGQEEGIVGEEENLLVERAFRLDELTVWEVMIPRVDIFAWRDTLTLQEILPEMESVPYSRVPVYGESIDDVTGIVYIREAYEWYAAGRLDARLSALSREPFFVPGSLPLTRILRDFQARRIHMGIVADEFGGTDGLVTLEDVLEELVGEIEDETDVTEDPLIRLSRNEIVADGGIDLREINLAFNVALPQMEHRSLNGFIIEELGYVPGEGETIECSGVRIEVVEATETQVLRARLTKLPPETGS
jgi:CBS domain containing-hemolysin-like protein